jgi:signal transduction histidine kinase
MILRFCSDSGWHRGELVAEAVDPGLATPIAERYYFGDYYTNGDRQDQVEAVANIYAANQQCHPEFLTQFQARASLVVPLQSRWLWGLLCIHQFEPREWQSGEIEFAQQLANQLAIVLNQAELLAQTQQQPKELAQALEQLQKSQIQLIQMQKLSRLGQLVTDIADEISNPVNFIYGNIAHAAQYAQQCLELLTCYQQEHSVPSPELEQHLEELNLEFIREDFPKLLSSMEMGSKRIRQLVLSLHSFSHPDVGEMQPANLHDGIDSTLLILHHYLKPKSNSRGINVVCEYGELLPVECHANQIKQVFMNLISNAIDALDAAAESLDTDQASYRPQITIRTQQIPDPQGGNPRVVICIADNGMGIPAQIQNRIFEPFFTTKPAGKGAGLGLSISRDIINQHGGELQCYSRPGQGTEFWIELPSHQNRSIFSVSSGSADRSLTKSVVAQVPAVQSAVL